MQLGLITFIFAASALLALRLYGKTRKRQLEILERVPENQRAELVRRQLEHLHIDASNLGPQQRLSLAKSLHQQQMERTRLVVSIVVTLAVLFSALYVILFTVHSEESQKWAFGAVGTIVGFWLKQ